MIRAEKSLQMIESRNLIDEHGSIMFSLSKSSIDNLNRLHVYQILHFQLLAWSLSMEHSRENMPDRTSLHASKTQRSF